MDEKEIQVVTNDELIRMLDALDKAVVDRREGPTKDSIRDATIAVCKEIERRAKAQARTENAQ